MDPIVNMDFLSRGNAQGAIAGMILQDGGIDPGRMRPFVGDDGRAYISIYKSGDPKSPDSYVNYPIQTNATLRRDEWVRLDEALLMVSEQRITGVQDLIDKGLTYDLGNGMGSTVLEYHDISDAMEADLTMDGITRGENDRPEFQSVYLPLPIIHVDYEINARVLAASRNLGNPFGYNQRRTSSSKGSRTSRKHAVHEHYVCLCQWNDLQLHQPS